jgi:hypothetical protein
MARTPPPAPNAVPSKPPTYSSIDLTRSQSPFRFSFHRLTLLSPPLTAKTFPLKLQLTRHSTASKFVNGFEFHTPGCEGSDVQMRTVLSCEAEAMYDFCKMVGAQATSRTQSVWPESTVSRLYDLSSGLHRNALVFQYYID